MRGRPLFLLGFMGSGKSTVGPLLARRLGRPFVDLDLFIEEKEGKTIESIFDQEGEEAFRRYETRALGEWVEKEVVVATGGGVVTREENWSLLAKGICVALVASVSELEARLKKAGGRPLLKGPKDWRELLKERESLYRRAPLVIDTTGLTPLEVVDRILRALEERKF